jgi:hypothetical protein
MRILGTRQRPLISTGDPLPSPIVAAEAPLVCPRCGRLLNRVTGKCVVCGDTGGAPPPITTTTTPPPQSAAPPAPAPPPPPELPREQRVTSAGTRRHLATVEGAPGRNKRDLVVYDGALVLAKAKGGRKRLERLGPMTPGQVLSLHPANVLVNAADVSSADVWERFPGGEVVLTLHNGVEHRFAWLDRRDRDVDVAEVLVDVLPERVAVEDPPTSVQVRRLVKVIAVVVLAVVVLVAAFTAVGNLLEGDPPPPPPPAPPTTLSPAQQAVQSALGPPCGPWRQLMATVPAGARPDPAAVRPVIEPLRVGMEAAVAADPSFQAAQQAVAELQAYARPGEDPALYPTLRLQFFRDRIDEACAAAGA